ncbi:uncharacterized protein LOC125756813 [Rhipicephalus sanguineus]|uniref:uncharacterized protein LOC125756813 n=1 Tax=Rhipicephalus sanguineus TaxID=34632 RepID=UPI0020C38AE0|nr:uncharacterized protein LOC125756813 [Rhipicephalus sanguineus]
MKRSYTLNNGTLEELKQAIAACPILGNLVALSTSRFQGGSVPITPCIVYDGADLPYARNLSLHVDKELMFRVSNGEEGILALMSAHWLLNIEYARKAFNVLVAIEWLLLGQRSTSPRTPVVKLLNVFKKAAK